MSTFPCDITNDLSSAMAAFKNATVRHCVQANPPNGAENGELHTFPFSPTASPSAASPDSGAYAKKRTASTLAAFSRLKSARR